MIEQNEINLMLNDELKETLEVFRTEQLEKVKAQLEKGHGEEVREALSANYQIFKCASHEQLVKMYIAFHKTLKTDCERSVSSSKSAQKRAIRILKNHRDHVEEALISIGGKRFQRGAFDAKSTNQVVRDYMRDIKEMLENNEVECAIRWLEKGVKTNWLE